MANDGRAIEAPSTKAKFRVFRARDAAELTEETMTLGKLTEGDMASLVAAQAAGGADGGVVKVLFEDEAAGMSLAYAWFKPNYILPRHSHDADCLYYVISGEARLGSERLRAGDGFFVPSDDLYTYSAGPEGVEILEFRTAVHFDFRLKTADAFWTRMIGTFAANRAAWREEAPPAAVRRFAGAD